MKTEEKANLNLKVKLLLDTPADHWLLINDSLIQEGSDYNSVRLRLFELLSLKKYVILVQLKKNSSVTGRAGVIIFSSSS